MQAGTAVAKDLAEFLDHFCRPGVRIIAAFDMHTGPGFPTAQIGNEFGHKPDRRAPSVGTIGIADLMGDDIEKLGAAAEFRSVQLIVDARGIYRDCQRLGILGPDDLL